VKPSHIDLCNAVLLTGSVTAAARMLNVSQPAVTKLLQSAENQLGFKLFVREKGRLLPTQEALSLQPEIFEIASRIQRLRDMVRELNTERKAVLRVACVPSIAAALLPPVLARFMKQYPNVICHIETHSHAGIIDRLLRRQSDIGFSLASVPGAGIVEEALVSGRGVCVAPRAQFSEKKKEVTWNDLSRHPVIRIPASSKFGGLMFEASQGQGLDELPTSPVMVTTNLLAMKLAEQGVGIAAIDSFTASAANLELVRILPLSPPIEVRLNWIRRTEGTLSNAARRFIQMVAAVGRERSV
jgi:DNA-binding transcriptional LysR family regulator